jgi:hypothetical protein
MSGDVVAGLREYAQYIGSWGSDDDAAMFGSAAAELERLRSFVSSLSRVLNNEGPNPVYHRQMMNRHAHEWPALWNVLGGLRRTD